MDRTAFVLPVLWQGGAELRHVGIYPLYTVIADSQNGQMMWSSLDAVGDRTLLAASFAARLQTYRPAGWWDIHRKVDRG
jgi:hypothetical protein